MKTKTEWKVGLFLAISLVVTAVLVISFSKGTNPLTKIYTIHLTTKNVDGLVKNAVVMMAGVPVGKISAIHLNTDTYIVTLDAKIKAEYQILADAKFFIETAGFLGDKYIGVIPGDNKLPPLQNGATVVCQESFDLVRAARSATDLMDELKTVASQITNIVNRAEQSELPVPDLLEVDGLLQPGRIVIEADNLDLRNARIRAEGGVRIKTRHLVGSTNAVIDCQNLSLDIGNTNGLLVITNMVQEQVERFTGGVKAYPLCSMLR